MPVWFLAVIVSVVFPVGTTEVGLKVKLATRPGKPTTLKVTGTPEVSWAVTVTV